MDFPLLVQARINTEGLIRAMLYRKTTRGYDPKALLFEYRTRRGGLVVRLQLWKYKGMSGVRPVELLSA
jgi:hypothetical protein